MMKKLFAVILALAMLAAISVSAAEQAPAVWAREGIMGMSPAEVKEMMGTEPESEYNVTANTYETDYLVTFAGDNALAGFIYVDDSLTMIGLYNFETLTGAEGLAALNDAMTAAYGESTAISPEDISKVFTTISGGEMEADMFSNGSMWIADDTAQAWTFHVGGQPCYAIYLSREYADAILTQEAVPDDVPKAEGGNIEGTWVLSDLRAEDDEDGEIAEILEMVKSGEMTQSYSFVNGELTATMSIPAFGMNETIKGTYRISGNLIYVTEEGEDEESDPVEFSVDGDTLYLMSEEDVVMIFARQN